MMLLPATVTLRYEINSYFYNASADGATRLAPHDTCATTMLLLLLLLLLVPVNSPSRLAKNATFTAQLHIDRITLDFIVAWRSAWKLGGAIRYRMDQKADDASGNNTNDNTSPPLASQHGSEEECDEEETEANLSGGGVFLDRDADDFTFRLSQLVLDLLGTFL
eukprot:COSAG02_NODE_1371_length_13018_cov_6.783265_10_plen_164_part_00